MDCSRLISERLWSQPDKAELECTREQDFIDDIVQKHHLERELLGSLEGVETAFDGGAGTGRFSLLLAQRGVRVVHFDISAPMIEKAKELARAAGVERNMTFTQGALENLSMFQDRQFDLVLSFDAPVSYTYPNQQSVIRELVRIAKKKIMLSVSSRLGALPYFANPIQKNQFFLDADSENSWVRWGLVHREELVAGFVFDRARAEEFRRLGQCGGGREEAEAYERGEAPWPITYHFLPDELRSLLEGCGVKGVELAGPGAFARTLPNEMLVRIMRDGAQKKDFLDFCYEYDRNPYVCGMGKDNLFAKGSLQW